MYSISSYGSMITDSGRMAPYVKALRQAVKPNSIVLDVGAGTGIFAFLACQLGAKKVYAIEPDISIHLAKEMAVANGYADRIEFIQDLSTKVTLPEPPDVCISDLRGVLPLFQHHILAIADIRKRLLSPEGVLIPQQDQIWATLVSLPDFYKYYTSPWQDNPYGIEMQSGQRFVTNTWCRCKVKPEQCLVEPQHCFTIDYTAEENSNFATELTWTVSQTNLAHGICIWFDTTLIEGIGFSNAPDQPELIYGRAFFPWSQAVDLVAGDQVRVQLQATLVNNDYLWRWDTQVWHQGDYTQVKANFQQSTFFGQPLSPTSLQKQAASYQPCLNSKGKIVQLILTLMEKNQSLGEIAKDLAVQFPTEFATWKEALNLVGEISEQYSQ